MAGGGGAPPLTREEVLRYIQGAGADLNRRELIQALAPAQGQRTALKLILRDLAADGLVGRRRDRERSARPERPADGRSGAELPPVSVLDVAGIDENGDLVLTHPERPELRILLPAESLERDAPGVGDRLLARMRPGTEAGTLEARVIKVLPRQPSNLVGIIDTGGDGWRLRPADRRIKAEFSLDPRDLNGAERGDLVLADVSQGRRLGLGRARVARRIGRPDDPSSLSLMTALGAGLPLVFPDEVEAQAAKARPVRLGNRTDLRELALVTIDGEDARDFDDAVWAAPDPANPGGHRLVVAIADVAHYVRPGDALDEEARKRGNSVYLPDRVIPMLPEKLSNDLCSLRPDGDRACLACEMTIDAQGELRQWRFVRGLMRSRARLTYTQVEAAHEGRADELTAPLMDDVIRPLYAAFDCLLAARRRRGTIELEIPERRIVFENGRPARVQARERQLSNMLIEEFMIAANVAAARALGDAHAPGLYRVHDKPDPKRLESLAEFLERLGVPWSRNAKRPGEFTKLLAGLAEHEMQELVSTLVLRSQAQAIYSPENIGHFGLNLRQYAHFTSPIRRYSDLVVHRALIRLLDLGDGGQAQDTAQLKSLGEHLSRTERRAMEAERRTFERFVASFMADQVGARFKGRVTSTASFGLFVALAETGAEGLVPISTLGDEPFQLDERHHALVGQRTGESFGLGDRVEVTLLQADPVQGSLLFRLEQHEPGQGAELARTAWRKGGGRVPRGGRIGRGGRSPRRR